MNGKKFWAAALSVMLAFTLSACSSSRPTIGINSYSGNASITTSQEAEDSSSRENTSVSSDPTTSQGNVTSTTASSNSSSVSSQDEEQSSSTSSEPNEENGSARVEYTPLGEDSRYCYTSGILSKSLKLLYCNIRNAVKNRQPSLALAASSQFSTEDLMLVMRCVNTDFPEFYWFSGSYTYQRTNGAVTAVDFEYLPFNDAYTAAFNKAVDDFVQSLPLGLSEYERELMAHDYLCSAITYCSSPSGSSNDQYIYSAYGALVNKNCVCEGYSRAMQLLMQRVGIQCSLACGTAGGDGHMWNIIQIDNRWYHVDLTWDDPTWSDIYTHMYFNVTTAQLEEEGRVIDKNFQIGIQADYNLNVPICSDITYNYYKQSGLLLDGTDDIGTVTNALKRADESGAKQCEFYAVEGSEYFGIANDDTKQDALNDILYSYGLTHFTAIVSDSPNKIFYSWA